ncbi:hypothetical protein RE476_09575 [Methanolobus mangrovi]|uniref:DUF4868 domain-containing protein n=1 Tax=Methanolobus mangrovi TaxID=3072977 RepID=A0AA51YG62_9EURY|nr:hypothetical protein [Methanolobus mangrovi]WMW21632.1 hypothetical protein RE476_09575 [Methanolobus mangrovi]
MSEVSIYLFKSKKNGFTIYKVPISSNLELLEELIENELDRANHSDVVDYFQVYELESDSETYFSISNDNSSSELVQLVNKIVLNNTLIQPINEFVPRRGTGDKVPFDSFAIMKKDQDGNFLLGFENLSSKLKLYKKSYLYLQIGQNYSLSDTDSIFLIPTYTSMIVKGSWNAQEVLIDETLIRSKATSFFEKMFNYRNHWKEKAQNMIHNHNVLDIGDDAWNEYSHDIRNVRTFVRTINSGDFDRHLSHVREYSQLESLENKLEFELLEDGGNVQIRINSSNAVKDFIDAYKKNILQSPLPSETNTFYRTNQKEEM